ncbi:nicotinate phosphoribosyltransferase [Buchnera aphidicola]|uniref:Nicotinate phosphoribosyltransferase n=1 Tax=Buchnera aphidicola subsp. Schizaphis graminum (strain Sg) TaxID=198804 RepID=PNCB_BUCAP|nr:nicotinate phosphoribosyltransferase [Buchnera aphidicola]Q8K9I6.1 RecName: Full=Nicotinate phosphoribosyltransferase; Short=NAPRTase [Buchnera aphidicola str. Sg (Schizaphis graminum)]AAM67902.1 nicotinate phosphoribosyltransferase [Buchnera aphidicola str. Sg (Schizaphis graminum)]AWI49604.1 nicotinate phosphoribosyltransferase [Buchnera aphidicola (Schizaphis graminum)]
MKQYNYPIVKTLLDTDAYKFYMQQAVFYHYKNVDVVAEFICRGPNILGCYSHILLDQINMMSSLSLSHEEYLYMTTFPFFKKEYLHWLKKFRYNITQVKVDNYHGQLHIRISGLWKEVILWEVPILSLISEIFHRHCYPEITSNIAVQHLNKKLKEFFKKNRDVDLSRLKIVDFGTRRRFSYDVQYSIIKRLKDTFPFLIGSSNYHISRILKLLPVGTQAHEWFQAHQQISSNLRNSQTLALKTWLSQYNQHLSIALTDCITMDSFLRDFNLFFSKSYQGIRHDSGDPVKWGEKAIEHYERLGIDPTTKTLLFSDNLNFRKMISLYKKFNNRVNIIFGIGTKLTCDIPNVKPLNIVIKLVKCNGKPVAKLSDSPGKTFCLDRNFIKSLCKAFDLSLTV